jgi:hypothetical protein
VKNPFKKKYLNLIRRYFSISARACSPNHPIEEFCGVEAKSLINKKE